MFTRRSREPSRLDKVIDTLLEQMLETENGTDEYKLALDQLVKLYKMKETETPRRVSPDTLILVAGNLVGVVLILGYERAGVVTSKALAFLTKLR